MYSPGRYNNREPLKSGEQRIGNPVNRGCFSRILIDEQENRETLWQASFFLLELNDPNQSMFLEFFIKVAAIFCMVGFGILARKLRLIGSDSTTQLSKLVTWFFYPALVFSSLVENFTLDSLLANWALPVGTIVIMATGYIVGFFAMQFCRFSDDRQKHQFLFQSTINNYSFLPLPIILMLWGEAGVAMLVFSTLGSEIALWTLGIFALTGNRLRRDSLTHLLSVPMVAILSAIAVIALSGLLAGRGLEISPTGVFATLQGSFIEMLDIFGQATIPLAMFLAGSRVADLKLGHFFTMQQVSIVLLRLLLVPAAAVMLLFAMPFPDELMRILLVVAVMPSAIMSVVLSEVYDSDTDFAASTVLTTQLVSIFTIPVWLTLFLG